MPTLPAFKQRSNLLPIIVLVLHVVGVVGTLVPATRPLTLSLTPVNLLVSALLLVVTHRDSGDSMLWFFLFTFLVGYFVEVLGIHTGFPFGEYQYGNTLGWKLLEVPLVIGVNWFLLAYCFGVIANQLPVPIVYKVLLAALGMVLLDFVIEPVAIRLDYWNWEEGNVPWSNYLGWLAVSIFMQVAFRMVQFSGNNLLAKWILMAQILYFGAIYTFLIF